MIGAHLALRRISICREREDKKVYKASTPQSALKRARADQGPGTEQGFDRLVAHSMHDTGSNCH